MRVPDRWLKCPRRGDLIAGKFVPFKTPLDSKYNQDVEEGDRFHVEMLVSNKFLNIGMIIDLTKSYCYYNERNVADLSCHYKKIECDGFERPPTLEQVNQFIIVCKQFFAMNPGEAIGVHCTHGFNRTGFMIICYLVEVEDWSLNAAHSAFCKARPPGIYKKHYLEELNARYIKQHEMALDEAIATDDVIIPDWDTKYQPGGNNFEQANPHVTKQEYGGEVQTLASEENPYASAGSGGEDIDSTAEVNSAPENFKDKKILDVHALNPAKDGTVLRVRKFVTEALGLKNANIFPGAQPVSMDLKNIQYTAHYPYKVSWKADGTKLMIAILDENEIFGCDRDFAIYPLAGKISFFKRLFAPESAGSSQQQTKNLTNTILDGELVIDNITTTTDNTSEVKKIPRYLVFDVIMFSGKNVCALDFDHRTNLIAKEIVEPRNMLISQNKLDRQSEIFGVRIKPFYELSATSQLISNKFKLSIAHPTDGLIYQPVKLEYKPFTSPMILKWKPPEMNSLDFLLKIIVDSGPGKVPVKSAKLFVSHKRQMVLFGEMKYTKELDQYNNCIIECVRDFKNKTWLFYRHRVDKSFPNDYHVALNVNESIRNPVTEQILVDFIAKYVKPSDKNSAASSSATNGTKMKQNEPVKLTPHAQ